MENWKYEIPIKDGEINGVGIEFYETGAKKSETPYVNGSRNGQERGYAEAGHKLWEADWRDDKLHGKYVEFYASGKTNSLTPYVTGLNKGTSTGWHETGEKAWQAKWDGNKPVGTHYEWFPDGKLKRQQSFANGKLMMISEWYANGQKTMEASYNNGKLTAQKRWNADGKPVFASGTSAPPSVVGKKDPNLSPPKPNPNSPGRRKVWNAIQLSKIYTGKPSTTVQATFGLPDTKRGDTWVYGNMTIIDPNTRRRLNTANFLIRGGKVLLVGGKDSDGNPSVGVEIYDSGTGEWNLAADLAFGRYLHTATTLDNGDVLITGGWGADFAAFMKEPPDISTSVSRTGSEKSKNARSMARGKSA